MEPHLPFFKIRMLEAFGVWAIFVINQVINWAPGIQRDFRSSAREAISDVRPNNIKFSSLSSVGSWGTRLG